MTARSWEGHTWRWGDSGLKTACAVAGSLEGLWNTGGQGVLNVRPVGKLCSQGP